MLDKGKEPRDENHGKDPEFERWVDSTIRTMDTLYVRDVRIGRIFKVPEHIRKLKVEAYIPKVVSIGPLHRGTRTGLVYMEEIKWGYMHTLFLRTPNPNESLKKCSELIFKLDEVVRAGYDHAVNTKFNSYDLSKIMLLDGCFLLELLIQNDKGLHMKLQPPKNYVSRGFYEARGIEEVKCDLTLLENQIPLFILRELSMTLFPDEFQSRDRIINLALPLLGYYPVSDFKLRSMLSAYHFFELAYLFITKYTDYEDYIEPVQENRHFPVLSEVEQPKGSDKLKRCATRLQAAGVTIKPPNEKSNKLLDNTASEKRFNMNIQFNKYKGELTIPPLRVTETTEVKWRNFIAWELNEIHRGKFVRLGAADCKFIWYAWFFQALICSVHDVQLLRDKKIILVPDVEGSNHGKKKKTISNEDVLNFFRKITEGIMDDVQIPLDYDFYYMFEELNTYQSESVDSFTQARRITRHFCRGVLTASRFKIRNAYRALKREYIPTGWKLVAVVAAVAALGLTAAQTGLAARFH